MMESTWQYRWVTLEIPHIRMAQCTRKFVGTFTYLGRMYHDMTHDNDIKKQKAKLTHAGNAQVNKFS